MVWMPQNLSALHALRDMSDESLLALLQSRPDLATPPPGSLPGLLARALTRPSLERALATLNTFQLQVLEACAALAHTLPHSKVTSAAVRRALGAKVSAPEVRDALDYLKLRLLITGSLRNIQVPSPVWAALGPFPAGLGPSLEETLTRRGDLSESDLELWTTRLTSPEQVTELVSGAPEKARTVINMLTWGPPIGNRGSGASSANSPLVWLIERGLLATAGESHVALPREIALIMRGGLTHSKVVAHPPQPESTTPTGFHPGLGTAREFSDASAGERVFEVVQLVDLLVEQWAEGGPTLRTGGIGVRELRRVAAALELDEDEAALLIEVSAGAQLLALRDSDNAWVPSREHLAWAQLTPAEKWVQIAWSWLKSTRATWLIGEREHGQIIAPLSPGIDRAWITSVREATLAVLAQTEPGGVLNHDAIYGQLKWQSPRSAPHKQAVNTFLRHAQWLGVLGAGALTSAGRHLLAAASASSLDIEDSAIARAVAAVERVLPAEVAEIMVQGDLTVIVPGRPAPSLEWLWHIARVEQRGSAQVLRLTEGSIHDALARGWTSAQMLERLQAASVTGLPQPVQYLIADVERNFDQLRAHSALSVITTSDPTRAREILADSGLGHLDFNRVAPTVLISPRPLPEVLAALREAGHSVADTAQDPSDLKAARRRPSARGSLQIGSPVAISLDDAAPHRALMAIRAGEGREKDAGRDPLIARQQLAHMHEQGRTGWITLVTNTGKTQRRLVKVVGISSGRVRLHDVERESELVVQLHRISAVSE